MPDTLTSFDQQLEVLARAGCATAGLAPLRAVAEGLTTAYVLVPPPLPALEAVALLRLGTRTGFSSMDAAELARFRPTAEVPDAPYLLVDVSTGQDTLGVAPRDALPGLLAAGRLPLTLEEGLAVVLQHPGWLRERNCFEMLGSSDGSKRVTGLWVKADGRPRLGWCWLGAPHPWLGMASASARLTA